MAQQIIEWVLRLAVAAVFIYAGAIKAADTQQFALDVQNFQLTSWTVSILIAVYLPWLEILAGIAVLVRRLYSGALLALFGMTLVFLEAIRRAWASGLDISCGCFGKEVVHTSYPHLIVRDIAILAAIAALIWFEARRQRGSATPLDSRPSETIPERVKD